jgi:hypothetical protein
LQTSEEAIQNLSKGISKQLLIDHWPSPLSASLVLHHYKGGHQPDSLEQPNCLRLDTLLNLIIIEQPVKRVQNTGLHRQYIKYLSFPANGVSGALG